MAMVIAIMMTLMMLCVAMVIAFVFFAPRPHRATSLA